MSKKETSKKRTPPKNRRFSQRDCYLVDQMCDDPHSRSRFHRTFGNNANGNNKHEAI